MQPINILITCIIIFAKTFFIFCLLRTLERQNMITFVTYINAGAPYSGFGIRVQNMLENGIKGGIFPALYKEFKYMDLVNLPYDLHLHTTVREGLKYEINLIFITHTKRPHRVYLGHSTWELIVSLYPLRFYTIVHEISICDERFTTFNQLFDWT